MDPVPCTEFVSTTLECADLNQYWFSPKTIGTFVQEIEDCKGCAALVSSPSVYFSLSTEIRERSKVLDYDRQWEANPGFVFYDFNSPLSIPDDLHGIFDFILIDPPFITREVWEKYASTAKLLAKPESRILCTTIAENTDMMFELLGLRPVLYRPSIPTLVYQYSIYVNYYSTYLDNLNPEVDAEDWRTSAARCLPVGDDNPPVQKVVHKESVPNMPNETLVSPDVIIKDNSHEHCNPAHAVNSQSVDCLLTLRTKLNQLKQTTEAIYTPLLLAVRRRNAGTEAAQHAQEQAEAALVAAEHAAKGLSEWLSIHVSDVACALGEQQESSEQRVAKDRWHVQAVLTTVEKGRSSLQTVAAYNEFALSTKHHVAAIFRQSNQLLDRIKLLKRGAIEVDAIAPPA